METTPHNADLMSTVKMTELNMHLNQQQSITGADSHRAFGQAMAFEIQNQLSTARDNQIYLTKDDHETLVWAFFLTSPILEACIEKINQFLTDSDISDKKQ